MQHPLFEIVTTRTGAVSIRNKVLNEIMHNPVGPWAEANALYIVQSRLESRLQETSYDELVVFDVGLGAAANALATLHCAHGIVGPTRPLRMISFEREIELLRYTLLHAEKFAHFTGYVEIVQHLLNHGTWSEGSITWELRHGDFVKMLPDEESRPHIIFYDPYSSKVNREMWSVDCFRQVYKRSRSLEDGGTLLLTYSQATPIRVALLSAGFFVGHGKSTGPKEETTQAATSLEHLDLPLGAAWFERWQRSHVQFPFECKAEDEAKLREWIVAHPQFVTSKA